MGIIDGLMDERDAIKVDKGERVMSEDTAVYADDLGSCLGVAAYDPSAGTVYLAHFSTYGNTDLDAELEQVREDLEELREPYEVLAGGTMSPETSPLDDADDVRYSRGATERLLEDAAGIPVVDWNEPPVFNRLIVDPEHGILYDQTL